MPNLKPVPKTLPLDTKTDVGPSAPPMIPTTPGALISPNSTLLITNGAI